MKIRSRRMKRDLFPFLGDLRKSKRQCPLSVGDRVEEIASGGLQVRVGEIVLIRDDRRRSFELIQLNPHSLEPVCRGGDFAEFKRFRQTEDRCVRLDETKYAKRRTFCIGDVIRNIFANNVRYGIIVNFLHPDGLLPTSHENGYNGKDLLECIRISGRPGLFRKRDRNGQVMRFIARPERSKICTLLPMDDKGGLRIGNM
jgi:hypothetical protein